MILSHAIAVTYLGELTCSVSDVDRAHGVDCAALWCSSQSSTDAWWALVQTVSMSYALSILATLKCAFSLLPGPRILVNGTNKIDRQQS